MPRKSWDPIRLARSCTKCSDSSASDSIRTETDPDKIRRFLHHALNQYVTTNYGTDHLPALAVQIVQAQTRLDAFAALAGKPDQRGLGDQARGDIRR